MARILKRRKVEKVPVPEDGTLEVDRPLVSAFKWLPTGCISNPDSLIRAGTLTSAPSARNGAITEVRLIEKTKQGIRAPKHFKTAVACHVIDVSPAWDIVDFGADILPRDSKQAAAWEALSQAENGILNVACGAGKALAHGEPVILRRGTVGIEDARIGDFAAGTDGNYYKVKGVYPQGIVDLYRVTFTDGTHLDCSADHLWTFVLRRSKPGTRTVTCDTRTLSTLQLASKAGRTFFAPAVQPVIATKTHALPMDPYTLGALLGDGHLGRQADIMFTSADIEIVGQLRLPAGYRLMPVTGVHSGKATTYRISLSKNNAQSSSKLQDILEDLGVLGTYSHTKFIPSKYKCASPDDRLAVLQGLFDTDGSATKTAVEYSTVSKQLALDVQELVYSLGGTCVLAEKLSHYTKNGERSKDFLSYRAYIKLPDGMPPFRLGRKASMVAGSRQRPPYRAVLSVEQLPAGLATCIEVGSPDHLFLTRNYLPTHNTVGALQKIKERGYPAVVIVHEAGLANQWVERAKEHLHLEDSEIGFIQGPKGDWDRVLVIAMIQTLVGLAPDLSMEIRQRFGTVIFDEVHHLSAPTFNTIASLFYGERFGFTATVERSDGLHGVYMAHLGPVFYKDLSSDLPANITFVSMSTELPDEAFIDRWGNFSIAMLYGALGSDAVRNAKVLTMADNALKAGRKLLVLSHSVEHLKYLAEQMRSGAYGNWSVGLVHGGVKGNLRTDIIRKSQVTFASFKIAREALDVPELDTMIITTPLKDWGSFQQAKGRLERDRAGKKSPLVVVLDDVNVGPSAAMWRSIRRDLRARGFKFSEASRG